MSSFFRAIPLRFLNSGRLKSATLFSVLFGLDEKDEKGLELPVTSSACFKPDADRQGGKINRLLDLILGLDSKFPKCFPVWFVWLLHAAMFNLEGKKKEVKKKT